MPHLTTLSLPTVSPVHASDLAPPAPAPQALFEPCPVNDGGLGQPQADLRALTISDYAARDALHDLVFGPGALTRTAYRVREGTQRHSPYCNAVWIDNQMIAMIRFTPVAIGGMAGALMLGPLAVAPIWANQGYGRQLIAHSHATAKSDGVKLVLLVGDLTYYARLGFVPVPPGQIRLPGPVDLNRLLALELVPGALGTMGGFVAGADLGSC